MIDNSTNSRGRSNLWNLLLVVPFVTLLWVPFYNSIEPTAAGEPGPHVGQLKSDNATPITSL
jgi:hypothetical protein